MRRLAALALLLAAAPRAAAQAPDLDSLLREFAALPGVEARFVEEKRIALLAVPVRSEGRIFFSHDRLLRRVTSPEESVALIAGGELTMQSGGRVERLRIDVNPVLRGFVESFRAVLAGDRETLERFYEARLRAAEDGWELTLRPRSPELRRFLRVIRMRGRGVTIREMEMVEVSGDETRTEFREVNTARRFTDAEARRIFRVGARPD